jgi:hypothetical protein
MAEKSLSQVLQSKSAPAAAPTPTPAPTGDAAPAAVEATPAGADEGGPEDFDENGAPLAEEKSSEGAPAKTTEGDKEPWTKKAYLAEKSKRQEAERKAIEAQARFETLQQLRQPSDQPKQKTQEELDIEFWANPRKAIKDAQEAAVKEVMERELRKSVNRAKKTHADWQEHAEEFDKIAPVGSQLYHEMLQADDPAEFAYLHVETIKETKGLSNLADYKARLKEDARKELLEEIEDKAKSEIADAKKTVNSNAGARGSGAGTAPAWSGPRPLREIVKARR